MAQIDFIMPLEGDHSLPKVRKISVTDLYDSLRKGWEDFYAMPTHAVFLSVIYPLVGLILLRASFGYDLIPLLYPLATGFALLGPFAAIGLYELSRRRELGRDTSPVHVFDIVRSPSFKSIIALAALLLLLFIIWIAIARSLYIANFGYAEPETLFGFLTEVFTTAHGRQLLIAGNLIGMSFAVGVFLISVISFPLLLDRNVGVAAAMITSARVVLRNPITMALWGILLAIGLALGFAIFVFGLAVTIPVLGHASWHLYRHVVEPGSGTRPNYEPRDNGVRYGADFPAALFFPTKK